MERDLLDRVLAGRAWREDVEAFSEATGVVVAVLPTALTSEVRCPVCLLPSKRDADSSPCLSCFTEGSLGRTQRTLGLKCRGRIDCVLQPVASCAGAYLLVSGFVTSESDRKELLARLLEQGLPEREARRVARATPLIRRQAAEALAHLGVSHLEALLASEGEDSERALEYELLYEIGRGFDRYLGEFDKLAADVLDRALHVTAADAGGLFLLSADGRTLEPAVLRGDQGLRPSGPIELGRTTIGHAAKTGRSLLVSGFADQDRKVRTTSLAVPLRTDDDPIGVLVLVAADTGRPLSGTDLKLMELFAESATRALVNSRRYSDASDRLLELMQLNELSRALAADGELDRMVYLVTSVLDKLLDFEVGGILLLGREEPARIVLRADVPADALHDLLAGVAGCEISDAVMHRCSIVHADGALSEPSGDEVKWNVLTEDISTARPQAGYLFIASRDPDAFDAEDARLLHDQAAHASTALDKARTSARLRKDLDKLADYYDDEVEIATQSLMAALEPAIIIFLAGIIGTIIISVILPMAQMYNGLSNM
jgi:GAF domain-containing protein